jgi:hypothetical protein
MREWLKNRVPAYQKQGPKFKPQYHRKVKEKEKVYLMHKLGKVKTRIFCIKLHYLMFELKEKLRYYTTVS